MTVVPRVPRVPRVPAVATFVVAFTAALVIPGAAASPRPQLDSLVHPTSPSTETKLDVPYVPQSGVLCGGAALSMVLRYWGESRVYAEDFISLVGQDSSGIPTDVLTNAAERRGYRTAPSAGTSVDLAGNMARRWPTIVLLADGSERYHYVVVVGLAPGQVVVHDPADRPFRPIAEEAFQRRWAATGHWSLLILPSQERNRISTADAADAATQSPAKDVCAADAKEAVKIAATDLARAESLLLNAAASRRCRVSASTWRELAGVRFVQRRWSEASQFAETATVLDPLDEYAWRLLATSRFIEDDLDGALGAWNEIDEPRLDLARVDGLSRTRYSVVADQLSLEPGHLLTHERLGVAARRISELPGVSSSQVGFHPTTDQGAIMDVTVVEKPLLYPNVLAAIKGSASMVDRGMLVGAAFQTFFNREVTGSVTSLMGRGEKLSASWRWWDMRPRTALSLAVPRLFGLPGVVTVDGSWERQTYAGRSEFDSPLKEERRHGGLSLTDWYRSDLRWTFSAGVDRWQDRGVFSATGGVLEKRMASDRVAVRGSAAWWTGLGAQGSFGAASVDAAWRQSLEQAGWSVRTGVRVTDATAPRDLWPGAGTGQGRTVLLRAHPILDSGILGGPGFGPALAYGGVEHQRKLRQIGHARLDWVAFTDVARVWNRPDAADSSSFLVDVGIGLRVAMPRTGGGLKLDAAHGVRDGAFAMSVGWSVPWPAFQP